MGNGDTRKITVLLNSAEYDRFSKYCEVTGHKKSTLIARLIKEHLDREAFGLEESDLPLFKLENGRPEQ
jgi:hypothetical protein